MPNYQFEKSEDELLANRMYNVRLVFSVCAGISLLGPILMAAFGAHLLSLDGNTWVSVPIRDSDSFRELENPYVCQTDKLPAEPCPSGSKESSNKLKCFKFHEDHATRPDAMAICNAAGGGIVTIDTVADNAIIHSYCEDDSPCWLGLARLPGTNLWFWSDGGSDSGLGIGTYSNWAENHPIDKNDLDEDLGAYAVLGYKRWAGGLFVMGLLAVFMIGFELTGIVVVGYLMDKGLKEKNAKLMCIVIACDAVLAALLGFAFLFTCVGISVAEGYGIFGGVLTIIFVNAELLIVAYLIRVAVRLRKVMSGSEEAKANPDTE